jgi:hypothetical protein
MAETIQLFHTIVDFFMGYSSKLYSALFGGNAAIDVAIILITINFLARLIFNMIGSATGLRFQGSSTSHNPRINKEKK